MTRTKQNWYTQQAAYWGFKWVGYVFNPLQGNNPKMAECARLAAHFALASTLVTMQGQIAGAATPERAGH